MPINIQNTEGRGLQWSVHFDSCQPFGQIS